MYWHPVLILLFLILLQPSRLGLEGRSNRLRPLSEYARGLLWTWYLDFSSVSSNQPQTTPMWMYWTGTLGHIPRHPSRMSLNNNIRHTTDLIPVLIIILLTWPDLITLSLGNSGYIAQLMVKWGIWYIQEGLLIWVIPSMYWSLEPEIESIQLVFHTLYYIYTVDELHILSLIWFKHEFMHK